MIPEMTEPMTPLAIVLRPIIATSRGDYPKGLKKLLSRLPKAKKRPTKLEKAMVSKMKLLFFQACITPSPKLMF